MNCTICGAKLRGNEGFCPKCGVQLRSMAELVALARQGSEAAISDLYACTYNAVYASVKAKARIDEDTVLDVVQDAYVKGFQSLNQLQNPEQFQAWMKTIAMNRLRDVLKRNRPTLFSELSPEEEDTVIDFEDERVEHLPDIVVDRQETARLIGEILDTLTDEQRMAVVLYYYEEMSVKEIANLLECSENTVKSRLNYARKKIKAQVEDLERRGTKLYGLAPLPFLLLLLRNAEAYGPSLYAPGAAAIGGARGASAPGGVGMGPVPGIPGATAGAGLVTKIVAGVLALTLTVGGGIAAAKVILSHNSNRPAAAVEQVRKSEKQEKTVEETTPTADNTPDLTPYQVVLDEFVQAEQGEQQARSNRDSNVYLTRRIYDSWVEYGDEYWSPRFYYALHDMDQNGTPELLVAGFDNFEYEPDGTEDDGQDYPARYEEYMILEGAYTLKDGKVYDMLADVENSGTLKDCQLYLCNNDWIYALNWVNKTYFNMIHYYDTTDVTSVDGIIYQNLTEEEEERILSENAAPRLNWHRASDKVKEPDPYGIQPVSVSDSALAPYQELIAELKDASDNYDTFKAHWTQYRVLDRETTESLIYDDTLYPWKRVKYALYDFNGDGQEELLVATENLIMDIYSDDLRYPYQLIEVYTGSKYMRPYPWGHFFTFKGSVYMDDGYLYRDDWSSLTKMHIDENGKSDETVETWTYDEEARTYSNEEGSFTREEWKKRVREHDFCATLSWTELESTTEYGSAKEAYEHCLTACKNNWNDMDADDYVPSEPFRYADTMSSYVLHDIDGNGTKELIIDTGGAEAIRKYLFFTFRRGKLVPLGRLYGGHSSLALNKNGELIVQNCHMGLELDTKVTIEGDRMVISTEYKHSFQPEEDLGYTQNYLKYPTYLKEKTQDSPFDLSDL